MSIIKYFNPTMKARLLAGERIDWLEKHVRGPYIKQCCLSFPDWVNKEDLLVLWEECRRREKETGVRHVLDHIIPVTHPMVSGLSVPWNLQVITYAQNAAKGNKWNPDQLDLFGTIS